MGPPAGSMVPTRWSQTAPLRPRGLASGACWRLLAPALWRRLAPAVAVRYVAVVRFASRSRALVLRAAVAALTLGALLSTVPLALADTAAPPTAAESNTVLLALVAVGALTAIIVLNRPRRGSGPK